MQKGCILLARQIQESEIWKKPAEWLKIWVYILLEVSHKKNNISERGEKLFNYKDIAYLTKTKYFTAENCVRWLKSTEQITTRKTTRGVYIKVLNYDKYQSLETYRNGTENGDSNGIKTEQERNRNGTINKNDNNEKNDNKQQGENFLIFEKLKKWFEQLGNVQNPQRYAENVFNKYPPKIIGKALNDNSCVSTANFYNLIEFYKNKSK